MLSHIAPAQSAKRDPKYTRTKEQAPLIAGVMATRPAGGGWSGAAHRSKRPLSPTIGTYGGRVPISRGDRREKKINGLGLGLDL